MILGDLGADVTGAPRRGPPDLHGIPTWLRWPIITRKRSVTPNLKRLARARPAGSGDDGDGALAHAPSAALRLGIDYETLVGRNPRLIYAHGPGYMPGGSRANDPAFDDVLQGESGIADLMLKSVGKARYLPTVMVDKFCGYTLASAVGMALFARERTGLGQQVCVPMFETLVAFNLQEHLWGAAFDPPLDSGIGYVRLLSGQRRPYETKDSFICVLAVNDEQWKRLLPAIGRPDLVDVQRFRTVDMRIRPIDDYGIVANNSSSGTRPRACAPIIRIPTA
jgi:crotonobetainyl-CoA:carnitine CoA-transferase CaiB-like acyl-CoA transferase